MLPADLATVQAALVSAVVLVYPDLEGKVVWASSDGPRPERPFVRFQLNGPPRPLGRPEMFGGAVDPETELLQRRAYTPVELSVAVEVYTAADDDSAEARSETLRAALRGAEDVADALQAAGLAAVDVEAVRNLDAIAGARNEKRRGFDLRLRAGEQITRALDWIETVTTPTRDTE